ncbi:MULTISPECIES: heme biosynthesis HemY N-terminal domain-containing protein [unclassified Pseudomonas]|uniref:heme biosynthesis HemY N-terminal domain-containing protein n=1 Tax=unclassified Pseudomonas TaxID=196821 RepID=UPI0024492A1B|nr:MULTISPECIES: heme biosynthesis HemY N-terminal domain-containing protein [unclassified Pseudomonas]MDG9922460.1 tetratricopeptide repeat protein [Pseudomonas sp. GD04045]MDH0034342.1 tetratricopeptide repeat protein [Pseudomonas sp. GD04019]
MMRAALLLILVVAAATALGLAIVEHSGYVLIAWKGLRYESSLWVFLLLIVVAVLLLWTLRWLVRLLLVSGGLVNPWSRRQRGRRQQLAADKGLLDLIEGRWERAVRHLRLAAEGERQPLMYYLGAARAAHKLGRVEESEELLEQALRRQPQAELAIALTHAELQREQGNLQGALDTLQAMRERHPRHHIVLEQLQRTLVERGDWAALLELLPELRKAKVLEGEALAELERKVWIARLQSAGEQGLDQGEVALQPLTAAWQQLSSAQRQDAELLLAYAGQLRALGAQEEAEEVLRKALKQGYDARLMRLYGQLRGRDPARQLQTAEGLLKQHPQDPLLLLSLGRLCLQNGLWGKAREYFEISLEFSRSAETCAELARLLASQGDVEGSNRLLQEMLMLQGQRLPQLPQPTH